MIAPEDEKLGSSLNRSLEPISRLLATLPCSTTCPLSPSTQNRCHRSPRSNPIIVLSCLLFCCSLIRPRVYQTLSRQSSPPSHLIWLGPLKQNRFFLRR